MYIYNCQISYSVIIDIYTVYHFCHILCHKEVTMWKQLKRSETFFHPLFSAICVFHSFIVFKIIFGFQWINGLSFDQERELVLKRIAEDRRSQQEKAQTEATAETSPSSGQGQRLGGRVETSVDNHCILMVRSHLFLLCFLTTALGIISLEVKPVCFVCVIDSSSLWRINARAFSCRHSLKSRRPIHCRPPSFTTGFLPPARVSSKALWGCWANLFPPVSGTDSQCCTLHTDHAPRDTSGPTQSSIPIGCCRADRGGATGRASGTTKWAAPGGVRGFRGTGGASTSAPSAVGGSSGVCWDSWGRTSAVRTLSLLG